MQLGGRMKLVSGIVDSGFFAQSALSAEVATKDSLGRNISETYLTGVDIPESANWNSTYNTVHDNSASWTGGTANPQIPVTGINGIKISESGDKVVFEVSGDYATTAQLAEKQDITGMTAYQSAGDYLTTADSANFYTTANESGFITGVDLTPYQTIEGMTAYQPVGDYLTTGDSANFYTTANESGFITGVPDTYLQNTDLSTEDGKVTAISGIPLSAGGDVPEGVMVESGLEYNAVNEISAYNGSAIAQYGAEKQWLQHDDTIVHVANSAQYAFGCNISALQRLMGIDETVLFFAGDESSGVQSGNLTESIKNFKRIRVAGMDNDGHTDVKYIYPAWTKNADGFSTSGYEVMLYGANPYASQSTVWEKWTRYSFSALTSFNVVLSYEGSYTANSVNNVTNNHKNSIREVVGIGRISG